jgi:hypothetical protein
MKNKVTNLDIVVRVIGGKPYYSLKYKKLGNNYFNVGYSSYSLENVIAWKNEYFDMIQQDEDDGWISVKYHQISEKERTEEFLLKDIQYMLDCKMPDDGQEILVTNGGTTWQDTSFIDCDGYYLDSGYDWIEITAWRPLPEPYKED